MPEEVRADLLLGRDTLTPGLVKAGQAASDASGNVRQLTRDLYEAGKVRATPVVDLQDAAATAKLDEVAQKLRDLGARVTDPKIDVEDKTAVAAVAAMRVKLDELGRKVSSPRVTLDGVTRAEAQILALDVQLDKLAAKNAVASVGVSGGGRGGLLGRLQGLFGGGGGAAGGGGGLGEALSGGLGSPVGIGALAGGGLLAAGLVPGLVGLGIGGLGGLGAVGGGLAGAAAGNKILKADQSNITQITTALKTAIGKQKQQLSASLKDANKQFAKDSNFYAPFIGFQKSIQDLAQNFLKPLRPIMEPLAKIVGQFGQGIAKLGPQFTALFQASLPFIQQFAQVMLQSGKILLPAFTQALETMVKSGALKEMTQGLVYLVQGFAGFIQALGPGMKASGQIFERVSLVIKDVMIGIGKTVSFIANALEVNWGAGLRRMASDTAKSFDAIRHNIATVFDGIRHDVASVWDTIWNNTIGRLQRGVADDQKLMNQLRHNIASVFDGIRHDIAAAWDTIWNNTIGRVRSGISDVVGFFRGLPGKVIGALFGLGHSLYAFAHSALSEFLSGFKSIAGTVWSWVKSFAKGILGALNSVFHFGSPSRTMFTLGQHIMDGLLHGIKSRATTLQSHVGGIAGGVSGAFSNSAAVAQRYAAALLSQYHWSAAQMSSLIPLWNQESGWNASAVNPSSGAYGIPQALPAVWGHPYALGDYKNQVIWGLNYIRSKYGNPANAWAHEQAFNWYGSGLDAIISKPTIIGVGERGPEHVQVTPRGRGGGQRVVLEFRTRSGATDLERAIVEMVRHTVQVNGGDVQVALGVAN